MPSGFDAHLAPGLTRKVCQTVLFHHDLVGSARISESCRTRRHRLLNVFQHLRTHWHSYLLSDFVPHTSCQRGRNHHPFLKKPTLFHCATVFGCVSSGSCHERTVYQCLHEDHCSTPAERDNQERDWFLNCSRVEKHSNCSSFWKFVCHQSSFCHVGVVLQLQ